MGFLRCPRTELDSKGKPYSVCPAGRIRMERQAADDEPARLVLRCDHCSRRLSEVPGYPLARYYQMVPEDRWWSEEAAEHGYLPAGYLIYCGVAPKAVSDALRGHVGYCEFTHRPFRRSSVQGMSAAWAAS